MLAFISEQEGHVEEAEMSMSTCLVTLLVTDIAVTVYNKAHWISITWNAISAIECTATPYGLSVLAREHRLDIRCLRHHGMGSSSDMICCAPCRYGIPHNRDPVSLVYTLTSLALSRSISEFMFTDTSASPTLLAWCEEYRTARDYLQGALSIYTTYFTLACNTFTLTSNFPQVLLKFCFQDIPPPPVRLLASYHRKSGSIPGQVTPTFSQVGIVPYDATGQRVFSGISRFAPPLNSGAALFSPHFTLICSLNTSLLNSEVGQLRAACPVSAVAYSTGRRGSRPGIDSGTNRFEQARPPARNKGTLIWFQALQTKHLMMSAVAKLIHYLFHCHSQYAVRYVFVYSNINQLRPRPLRRFANNLPTGLRRPDAVTSRTTCPQQADTKLSKHAQSSQNGSGFTFMQQPIEKLRRPEYIYSTVKFSLKPNNNANYAVTVSTIEDTLQMKYIYGWNCTQQGINGRYIELLFYERSHLLKFLFLSVVNGQCRDQRELSTLATGCECTFVTNQAKQLSRRMNTHQRWRRSVLITRRGRQPIKTCLSEQYTTAEENDHVAGLSATATQHCTPLATPQDSVPPGLHMAPEGLESRWRVKRGDNGTVLDKTSANARHDYHVRKFGNRSAANSRLARKHFENPITARCGATANEHTAEAPVYRGLRSLDYRCGATANEHTAEAPVYRGLRSLDYRYSMRVRSGVYIRRGHFLSDHNAIFVRVRFFASVFDMDENKRLLADYFVSSETDVLISLAEKCSGIIEYKRTNEVTCKQKEEARRRIELEFNSACGVFPRSLKTLKANQIIDRLMLTVYWETENCRNQLLPVNQTIVRRQPDIVKPALRMPSTLYDLVDAKANGSRRLSSSWKMASSQSELAVDGQQWRTLALLPQRLYTLATPFITGRPMRTVPYVWQTSLGAETMFLSLINHCCQKHKAQADFCWSRRKRNRRLDITHLAGVTALPPLCLGNRRLECMSKNICLAEPKRYSEKFLYHSQRHYKYPPFPTARQKSAFLVGIWLKCGNQAESGVARDISGRCETPADQSFVRCGRMRGRGTRQRGSYCPRGSSGHSTTFRTGGMSTELRQDCLANTLIRRKDMKLLHTVVINFTGRMTFRVPVEKYVRSNCDICQWLISKVLNQPRTAYNKHPDVFATNRRLQQLRHIHTEEMLDSAIHLLGGLGGGQSYTEHATFSFHLAVAGATERGSPCDVSIFGVDCGCENFVINTLAN
ncbi:hypothetical protein PR048_020677 [Dryococelus australis]|uniref:Regulatory protein zeste n=1 Tax=Dryococelus australis TaxID=614101 RepID=A0ABQ9H6W0_9NEOP|nr:hypothetical protein PR048_020677 [Dryococelus australis]